MTLSEAETQHQSAIEQCETLPPESQATCKDQADAELQRARDAAAAPAIQP